jgi:hypothetical protein
MASLPLLGALRDRLHPDRVVYTEPTGALFRAAADATYNYDEHWLVESLLAPPHRDRAWRGVRTARELSRWLQDRDAATPPGSTIVHHIDSHDSIWWRLPGAQWRRERFGRDAAVALLAAFSLVGGGYMTFMGGEDGIEAELRRAHDLRRALPELAGGAVDHAAVTASSDAVLCVLRVLGADASVVAVNLEPEPVACELRLPDGWPAGTVEDRWNDEILTVPAVTFAAYQPRVLRRA